MCDEDPSSTELINSFSLVSYIPDGFGEFLDNLRVEIVKDCTAQSHITVLPPRPLALTAREAEQQLALRLVEVPPFPVEITELAIFPVSNVIYAEIDVGRDRLIWLHDHLNREGLFLQEAFEYHPHVTLAQGLPEADIPQALELAQRRWKESPHRRGYTLDLLTFVQNTLENRWQDLKSFPLVPQPAMPPGTSGWKAPNGNGSGTLQPGGLQADLSAGQIR